MARRRSPARFLAPLALVAVIVAGVMIVQGTRQKDDATGGTATTQSEPKTTNKTSSKSKSSKSSKKSTPKTYTVKSGDNLSTVAEETGVSVAKIEQLNPDLDAQSLQVGQKIKLSGSAQTP